MANAPTTTTTTPNKSEAIVPAPHGESAAMVLGTDAFRGSLEPQNLDQAFKLAELWSSIGYCGVTSPAEALARLMTGRSLGISATQSIRGLYTINGRQGIDATLMHALCLRSPLCEHFDFVPEESDETKATFVAKRRGRPEQRLTFTIEDAQRMGVVDRGDDEKAKKDNNWNRVRKAMLRARAKSELARIVFPDVVFGMYSREELEVGFDVVDANARDPNEIIGEIVAREEAPEVSPVQAAARDFAKEADELIAKIASATSRPALAEARKAFQSWDAPESDANRERVKKAYNDASNAWKRQAVDGSAAAPATTTGAAPGTLGEGNLFGGKEPTKP